MSGHFGEDAVEAVVLANTFTIVLRSHVTGAQITLTGPLKGLFEDPEKALDPAYVNYLGSELAHRIREILV